MSLKNILQKKGLCDYSKLGFDIGALVSEKQLAYGDSFGNAHKVLEILYPKGIKPEQYPDALCLIRIIDKLFRIANKKDAFSESPYRDIAGYGLLGVAKDESETNRKAASCISR